MAETTTKAAAVWNPPRLMKLALGGTQTGTKPGGGTVWEVTGTPQCGPAANYRMPLSSEPSTWRPGCPI